MEDPTILERYFQSLKAIAAEELFDLLIYRPLAWPLVLLCLPLPITPNQVTLIAFLITVGTGVLYGLSTPTLVFIAGITYFISRVIDCVDGQLARARGGGSKLGKLYDGLSDYFGHIAVFIGLAFAFGGGSMTEDVSLLGLFSLPAWIWAFIAGFSLVYQCILADKYKNEYLTRRFPDRKSPAQELVEWEEELKVSRGLERLLLIVFTRYLRLQSLADRRKGEPEPEDERAREIYCRMSVKPLFAWNLLGPSMHANIIVILSLINRVDLYIPAVFVFMNLATLPLHIWQAVVNSRIKAEIAAAADAQEPS